MTDDFRSRYPDYDVLAKRDSPDWDEQTWRVVAERLALDPAPRFFSDAEARTLHAIMDRIIPQPDRAAHDRIPIVAWIDAKLYDDRRDGYRHEAVPPQREAWRLAIEGVDQSARARHGRAFAELEAALQDDVLRTVESGSAEGAAWKTLPAALFFNSILCVVAVRAYYSHPTAWSEIGYSGPASPRGHVRIWIGGVDAWEAHERDTRWATE